MDPREKHVRRVVTAWMQHFSECHFAALFAKNADKPAGRILIAVVDPWRTDPPNELAAALDAMFVNCGSEDRAALVVFPRMGEEEIVEMLRVLSASSRRWAFTPLGAEDPTAIRVTWKTDEGIESNVMGLAPFLTMPETRRMSYVGLALWPGKKSERTKELGLPGVSFRDMPSGLDDSTHKSLVKKTRAEVGLALGSDRDTERYAFLLPRRVTGR